MTLFFSGLWSRILLAAMLVAVSFAARADTVFAYSSVPGDYIGQGATRAFTPANASFHAFGNPEYLNFSIELNSGEHWSITIAAPEGTRLAPGRYVDAERASFRTGRSAGIDITGGGRGCNEIWGEVGIRQATFDEAGNIKAFEASFVQHCEGPDAPPLAGVIRYRAAQYSLSLKSDPGDYIGQGIEKKYFNDSSVFRLTGSPSYMDYSASGLRDNWGARISLLPGRRLRTGTYITRRFADGTHAGFDFSGNARGCNESNGVLDVKLIQTNAAGQVTRLLADFEQHCEGEAAALRGTIRHGF